MGAASEPQRTRTIRLGAAVVAAITVLFAAGLTLRLRRERGFEFAMPIHPAALAAPETARSRLLRWRTWSYPATADEREVVAFYDRELAGDWVAGPARRVARAAIKRYRRGEQTIDLRVEAADEPGRVMVTALLTDVRGDG